MAFAGWAIEAIEFYEGLEADNSKVYWQDHRAVYDRHVKAPMEELLAELADDAFHLREFVITTPIPAAELVARCRARGVEPGIVRGESALTTKPRAMYSSAALFFRRTCSSNTT